MEHDKTFPFAAAIFDLDGTLLNSLHVWRQVDHHFFGARGIVPPEDYPRKIAGMSFAETVAYTIERFGLSESPEAVFQDGFIRWLYDIDAGGYDPRFGLVYVDYRSNCARTIKDSALWYRDVIAANGENL